MKARRKAEQTSLCSTCPNCGLAEVLSSGSTNTGQNACPKCGHVWEDDFVYRPPVVTNIAEKKKRFDLSKDQIDALRALLCLVHYDDLALSWLDLLPNEIWPEIIKKEEDEPRLF